jgi:hypothetical protein
VALQGYSQFYRGNGFPKRDWLMSSGKARDKLRRAIFGAMPREFNIQNRAEELSGYLSALLEVAVGLSVLIWGKENAPRFLSKHINVLLKKHYD